jgi:hypothetical protein
VCGANSSDDVLFFDEITSQISVKARVKNQQQSGIGCMCEESVGVSLMRAAASIDRA